MQRTNSRRFTLKALTAAVALTTLSTVPAFAADTIKVGILHRNGIVANKFSFGKVAVSISYSLIANIGQY